MASVTIDMGHGGNDPGARGNGLQEKDITLNVGLAVGKVLETHDVRVVYTRTTDIFVDLSQRANIANRGNTDIFVSIHVNAFHDATAQGIETYSYPNSSSGATLANNIHNALIADESLYTVDRGRKTENFLVLRETIMPAVLVELGFITNIRDAEILRTRQDDFAVAIAKGILNNLNIEYREGNPVSNENQPSDWAKEAWEWSVGEGLLDGTRPKDFLKREELALVLERILREEE